MSRYSALSWECAFANERRSVVESSALRCKEGEARWRRRRARTACRSSRRGERTLYTLSYAEGVFTLDIAARTASRKDSSIAARCGERYGARRDDALNAQSRRVGGKTDTSRGKVETVAVDT